MKSTTSASPQYELITKRGSSLDKKFLGINLNPEKNRGYLAADNGNLYLLSQDKKVVKTIPLKSISKVRIKWGLMYVYAKWWLFISKEDVIYFERPQKLIKRKFKRIKSIPRKLGIISEKQYYSEMYVNNEPPEFAQWEKFFKDHNVKVTHASWGYYYWMNKGL